jgi:hypothetical protein
MCRQFDGYMFTKYELDEQRPTPGAGNVGPVDTPDHETPPLVDIWMTFWRGDMPPPPSFIVARKTLPSGPVVIWTSRTKLPTTVTGADQVAPPSSDRMTWRAPPPTAKLFQLMYARP